jgi:hypothetical protein
VCDPERRERWKKCEGEKVFWSNIKQELFRGGE